MQTNGDTTASGREQFTPQLAAAREHVSSDDDEEEDAWLALEVAKLEAEEAATPRDADAYHPQLMDIHAMHSLRRELRTSEARVQSDGRLREFVPRKPALALRPHSQQHRQRHGRPLRLGRPLGTDNNHPDGEEEFDVDPFVIQDGLKREYAEALREEVEQLNELLDQYDDTKRLLLDHLDMVCSTKPSERTNSHEVYEKLDELLAFAAKCAVRSAT